MSSEDKIVKLLNDNVNTSIDLNENYHMIKAKLNYDSSTKVFKQRNWLKSLSLSLVGIFVIILIAIPVFMIGFAKKGRKLDDNYNYNAEKSNDSTDYKDPSEIGNISDDDWQVLDNIIANKNFDNVFVRMPMNINKIKLQEIFNKLNIQEEIIDTNDTYSFVIGKIDSFEVLSYTNGNDIVNINLNLDYKIEDIYNELNTLVGKDIANMYIKIEGDKLVYYTSVDGREYFITK